MGDDDEAYIDPKSKEFKAMTDDMKNKHFAKLIEEMEDYPNGQLISLNAKKGRIKELLNRGFNVRAIFEKLKKEGY